MSLARVFGLNSLPPLPAPPPPELRKEPNSYGKTWPPMSPNRLRIFEESSGAWKRSQQAAKYIRMRAGEAKDDNFEEWPLEEVLELLEGIALEIEKGEPL